MMLTMSEIMIQEDQLLNMFLELGLEQFFGVVKDNQLYIIITTKVEYRVATMTA